MSKINSKLDIEILLLNKYKELNRPISFSDIKKEVCQYKITKFFGTFNNALIELNLPINQVYKKPIKQSKQDMLENLIKLQQELNRTPTIKDIDNCEYCYNAKQYSREFGGINNAFKLINIEIENPHNNKSNKELIEDFERLKLELGRIPTLKDIDDCDYCVSGSCYISRFNGYNNLLKELNYPINKEIIIKSNEELIDDFLLLYSHLGKPPTRKDIDNSNFCQSSNVYISRFGSYESFLKSLNLKPNLLIKKPRRYWNDIDIENSVIRLYNEISRSPTQNDINECLYTPNYSLILRKYLGLDKLYLKLNIPINSNTFAYRQVYENCIFDSEFELINYKLLRNYFQKEEIKHHGKYWNLSNHKYDFYIPKLNLYIETSNIKHEDYLQKIEFKKYICENILNSNFIFINNVNHMKKLLYEAYNS